MVHYRKKTILQSSLINIILKTLNWGLIFKLLSLNTREKGFDRICLHVYDTNFINILSFSINNWLKL